MLGHARVLRGVWSMWIATPRTSFLALSLHVALCVKRAAGPAVAPPRNVEVGRNRTQAVCVTILPARLKYFCVE